MNRTHRALVYCLAWTPYAASYFLLFRSFGRSPVALLLTVYNIVPAMLLGVGVLRWAKVLPWKQHGRRWFYPAQIGSALLYSVLWYVGILLLSSLGQGVRTHHFQLGYFSGYAMQWQFFSGLMIYGNLVGFAFVSQVNLTLREEERRRSLAEALQTRSELAVLRAQLNPHFLFNTLNSLVALVALKPARATDAILQLSEMLRYTLQEHREAGDREVSLREELAFTEQYLALETLRLGERLVVVRKIAPEALSWRLPALTIQPLVENSIRHGIAPRAGGGVLTLSAEVHGGVLQLRVEDDGLGADPDAVMRAGGVGLRTVQQRLALSTGNQAEFGIEGARGRGLCVSIRLPRSRYDEGFEARNATEGEVYCDPYVAC